uniref:Uncharacterized protein n=1 Tax=Fagus sylvatica TaxID=28930 RepID=A0A2N9HE90_FAGSY
MVEVEVGCARGCEREVFGDMWVAIGAGMVTALKAEPSAKIYLGNWGSRLKAEPSALSWNLGVKAQESRASQGKGQALLDSLKVCLMRMLRAFALE